MSRWTSLVVNAGLVGAIAVACGGRPSSPSAPNEMPPLAPRPEQLDPSAVPIRPGAPSAEAGAPMSPGPASASLISSLAVPAAQPVGNPPSGGTAQPGSPPGSPPATPPGAGSG